MVVVSVAAIFMTTWCVRLLSRLTIQLVVQRTLERNGWTGRDSGRTMPTDKILDGHKEVLREHVATHDRCRSIWPSTGVHRRQPNYLVGSLADMTNVPEALACLLLGRTTAVPQASAACWTKRSLAPILSHGSRGRGPWGSKRAQAGWSAGHSPLFLTRPLRLLVQFLRSMGYICMCCVCMYGQQPESRQRDRGKEMGVEAEARFLWYGKREEGKGVMIHHPSIHEDGWMVGEEAGRSAMKNKGRGATQRKVTVMTTLTKGEQYLNDLPVLSTPSVLLRDIQLCPGLPDPDWQTQGPLRLQPSDLDGRPLGG